MKEFFGLLKVSLSRCVLLAANERCFRHKEVMFDVWFVCQQDYNKNYWPDFDGAWWKGVAWEPKTFEADSWGIMFTYINSVE